MVVLLLHHLHSLSQATAVTILPALVKYKHGTPLSACSLPPIYDIIAFNVSSASSENHISVYFASAVKHHFKNSRTEGRSVVFTHTLLIMFLFPS